MSGQPDVVLTYTATYLTDGGRVGLHGIRDPRLTIDGRPLLIIDPEDREQVERLIWAFCGATPGGDAEFVLRHGGVDNMCAGLRSLIAPPKPEEPTGLGAVVEDADGVLWVRCENVDRVPHWYARNKSQAWDHIAAVRVLSKGVQP